MLSVMSALLAIGSSGHVPWTLIWKSGFLDSANDESVLKSEASCGIRLFKARDSIDRRVLCMVSA